MNYRQHYNPGNGAPVDFNNNDKEKLKHDILAKPIEEAMDQAFKDAFVTCSKDFAQHFQTKGWNRTVAQLYLNNKYAGDSWYGYSVWLLDEPFTYTDWAALNFFGRLFKQGVNDPELSSSRWFRDYFEKGLSGMKRTKPVFLFRGDVSRPMWQGSASDGIMGMLYANPDHFGLCRLVRAMRERAPMIVCTYGSCNSPGDANWDSAAWCLKAYVSYSDGVLPWQSIGGPDCLQRASAEGLIINGGSLGHAIASFRVHALRRGAQDSNSSVCFSSGKGGTGVISASWSHRRFL